MKVGDVVRHSPPSSPKTLGYGIVIDMLKDTHGWCRVFFASLGRARPISVEVLEVIDE